MSTRRASLSSIIPVFSVADIGATIHWYNEKLGFVCDMFPDTEPYLFAIMFHDHTEIMLQRIENYEKPDTYHLRSVGVWDAYVRTNGVKELYEVLKDKVTIVKPLREQFYGSWEFEIKDLNGYILVFGEFLEKCEV
jgi:uncharacterized glyoxalase superfamily protein PhnB